MRNKIIAVISMILIVLIISLTAATAITYECDVKVNSRAIVVASLESGVIVYERGPDYRRYASTLVELVDYLVVMEQVENLEESILITEDLVNSIPDTDHTLDQYIGRDLTIQDLLSIMMLTEGNDAATVLASYVCDGSLDAFTKLLNDKLKALKCTRSSLISPRPVVSAKQVLTCREVLTVFKELLNYDSFLEAAALSSFSTGMKRAADDTPEITTNNSLKKYGSPYFFSYVNQSKFGYDKVSGQNAASIGSYKNNNYIVVAMGGTNSSEENSLTDTKQMLIWAFTKLENVKIVSGDAVIASVKTTTPFGEDMINLTAGETVIRTLPKGYAKEDIGIKYDIPKEINLPVFTGQKVGYAAVTYKDEPLNSFDLVVQNSRGVSIIEDIRSALRGMYDEVLSNKPAAAEETSSQTESIKAESSKTKEKESTKESQ